MRLKCGRERVISCIDNHNFPEGDASDDLPTKECMAGHSSLIGQNSPLQEQQPSVPLTAVAPAYVMRSGQQANKANWYSVAEYSVTFSLL